MNQLRRKPRPAPLGLRESSMIDSQKHRRFIRMHACSVPGCESRDIEAAHYRTAANSGMQIKPSDEFCLALCKAHHAEQHQHGQPALERKYGIDMAAKARTFAKASPDERIRMRGRA